MTMTMNSVLLSRLKEISSAVMYAAEAHDLPVVLQRIAQISRELVKCKYAAIGIPDENGGLQHFATAGMTDDQIALMDHHPHGKGLIGAIMESHEPIRLADMRSDPRSTGFPKNHPPMKYFLGVPVMVGNQRFGMLYMTDREDGRPFTEEDEMLIEALAGYVAMAIAGTTLSDAQSRMNLLEERERIGMELHDGIIQSLYGIGMQVDMMRQDHEQIPSENMETVIDNLNLVIEDIRDFITDLRWRGGNNMTIRYCMEDLRDRLHLSDRVRVHIDAPDEHPPFTPAVFESICLIVNEAMSNAARHSGATDIDVWVDRNQRTFEVVIADNGSGFAMEEVKDHTGLGLRNMRQRARLYGGELTIDSTPGAGTTLRIAIPVRSH